MFKSILIVCISSSMLLLGCSFNKRYTKERQIGTDRYVTQWGVDIKGIRLSAGGYMLDFRFRILDPEKAQQIMDHKIKPYIIDEATGAKFIVPTPPKVGALRTKSRGTEPVKDKVYFIIFANPGRYVKAGNKVTVVVGDFRAEHLTVM